MRNDEGLINPNTSLNAITLHALNAADSQEYAHSDRSSDSSSDSDDPEDLQPPSPTQVLGLCKDVVYAPAVITFMFTVMTCLLALLIDAIHKKEMHADFIFGLGVPGGIFASLGFHYRNEILNTLNSCRVNTVLFASRCTKNYASENAQPLMRLSGVNHV